MDRQRGTRNTDTPAASHPQRHHQRQPTRRHHLRHTPHTRTDSTQPPRSHTQHYNNKELDKHTPASRPRFTPRGISQGRGDVVLSFDTTAPLGSPSRVWGSVGVVAAPASCIRVHTHASLCTSDAAVTLPDTLHSYCFTPATFTAHGSTDARYTRRDDTCATTHDTPSQPLAMSSHSTTLYHHRSGHDGSIATRAARL
jgi:hypothetical protein